MLNTIKINLKTDIKTDRPTTLPITLMSQDKNNNQFILRFTNGGEPVTLDDTYTVEILTKFTKSGTSRLTSATVRQDYATWEFDTSYITQDETVYNYVYVRKAGNLVVSADANCFVFGVDLSEIDKGAGKVAETYDENYEKYLDEFKDNVDFEEIAQSESERVQAETERKEAETLREENYNQKVDTAIVEADVVAKVDNKMTELTPQINNITEQLAKTSKVGIHDSNIIARKSGERKPMWTLIDDDGRLDFVDKWLPIMRDKNIPISIGVITNSVGKPIGSSRYMTWDELHSAEREGVELLSHTHNHTSLISLTEEQLHEDFQTNTQILRENGVYNNFIIYPYNTHNEAVRGIVREYFRAGISSDGQMINVPPVRTYRLSRIEFGKNDLAYYKAKIDECVAQNGWLISMTHSQYPDLDDIQLGYIREAIDYAKSLGVDITTFSKAYSHYANLLESGIDIQGDYSVIDADGRSHGTRWGQYEKQFAIPSWFTGNNSYLDFPKYKVTAFDVPSNQASTWSMPENTGGTLTMFYGSGSYYHYQTYKIINNGNFYSRFWDTANAKWGQWVKVNGDMADFVADSTDTVKATTLYNSLPVIYRNKYVVTRVNTSNASGFPTNTGGILITNGRFAGWYAYQEYHPLESNKIYKRYVVANNTWSEWVCINPHSTASVSVPETVVPANSTVDVVVDLSGVNANTTRINGNPSWGLNAGIFYNISVQEHGKVNIRLANLTSSDITITTRSWLFSYIA